MTYDMISSPLSFLCTQITNTVFSSLASFPFNHSRFHDLGTDLNLDKRLFLKSKV